MATQQKVFKRNSRIGIIYLIVIWVLVLICVGFLNSLMKKLSGELGVGEGNLRVILNLIMLGLLGISTIYYLLTWGKTSIEIAGDTLILQRGFTKRMIATSNITSVTVRQSGFGSRLTHKVNRSRLNRQGKPTPSSRL